MTPRHILTLAAIVGVLVLAALGTIDGDAALAFLVGALAPSVGEGVAEEVTHRRAGRRIDLP